MPITLRPAEDSDISGMPEIRACQWRDMTFWTHRITRYRSGVHSRQKARPERMVFVAEDEETVIGFVAGYLTR